MHDKPLTAALYILAGLALAFIPLLIEAFARGAAWKKGSALTQEPRRGLSAWGCAGGLLLGLTMLWWRPGGSSPTFDEIRGYLAIALVCLLIFRREAKAAEREPGPRWRLAVAAAAVALMAALCFTTGFVAAPAVRFIAWHHWGAFIAPAEVMRAGGRIFFDFAAQYGLGPTTVAALACGADCWRSMYYVAGGTALLFGAAGVAIAASFPYRTRLGLLAMVAAVFAAFQLWVALPPAVSSPLTTPSVTGLRFLPVVLLAAVLWWSETDRRAAPLWRAFGHTLFVIAALWSPEALFMTTAVWGPYYCLRRMAEAPQEAAPKVLMLSLVQLAAVLGATAVVFVLAYRLGYGVFPRLRPYLVYMLYPPGPLPINPKGPVWYTAAALAVGGWAALRIYMAHGNCGLFRRMLVLMLLSYASLSYALGRSHDNNFLNILPYTALILGLTLSLPVGRGVRGAVIGMLVSLLALLPSFGWTHWGEAIAAHRLVRMNVDGFIGSLSYDDPSTIAGLPTVYDQNSVNAPDIARAVAQVRATSRDPVTVLDYAYFNLPNSGVWTSLQGYANYVFMPAVYRQWFLANGERRFHRSGWLVIFKPMASTWVPDFQTAYDIDQDLDFGAYRAVHFKPKP